MRTTEEWVIVIATYIGMSFAASFAMYFLSVELLNTKRKRSDFILLFLSYGIFYISGIFIAQALFLKYDASLIPLISLISDLVFSLVISFVWAFILRKRNGTAIVKTAATVLLCTCYIENFINLFVQFSDDYLPFYNSEIMELRALFRLMAYMAGALGSMLILLLVRRVSLSKYFDSLFSSKKKSILTLILCYVLGNMHFYLEYAFLDWKSSASYISFCIFAAFAIVLLFLYLAFYENSKVKIESQKALILQQQAYVSSLENIQKEMRTFKHDYQNMMSGLYIQANEGDISAVQNYIRQSVNYFDDHLGEEIKQVTQISNIMIIEVKSLLLVKHMKAKEMGIDLQIEVKNQLESIDMKLEDFMRCLGILLDNAIEAASESTVKEVRLMILDDKEGLSVVVENAFAAKPNMQEMWKQGYSSKGQGRGVGLSSYQHIVRQYANAATNTTCEDDAFVQELKITRSKAK